MNLFDSIVVYLLVICIVFGLVSGLRYLQQTFDWRARWCYAGLMLAFSLAVLRSLLMHTDWFHLHPDYFFLPIWYTLSIGVLLFYGVKLQLYPAYRVRWTDAKHFILPIAQGLFYWVVFFLPFSTQQTLLQSFIPTWYKPLEGILFIVLFFSYLALSFRYAKFKEATLRKAQKEEAANQIADLTWMLKVVFALGVVNTSYLVIDFFAWRLFAINLYQVEGFAWILDVSFACMLLWMGRFAWKKWARLA